ncbi:uncharacterized protein LOC132797557 [Drosophila nasuta]|uniref:uncharacterized protein LOC132797557 n=1 Tax=Drosophila nasuta TaxID=42062 RepID=UPI00295F196B|nr:uncharacterized protein LOC132797557 [Drosophila nasuta]
MEAQRHRNATELRYGVKETGYARRLEQNDIHLVNENKRWYLPHFSVMNANKLGTALAKVDDVSLNSVLDKGPQHYNPAKGVCGDIKMFHQIVKQAQDRCAQRFQWRDGDGYNKESVPVATNENGHRIWMNTRSCEHMAEWMQPYACLTAQEGRLYFSIGTY